MKIELGQLTEEQIKESLARTKQDSESETIMYLLNNGAKNHQWNIADFPELSTDDIEK